MNDLVLSVSDFVAIFNQTIEYMYPHVMIVGELANLRISKKRWVYFDLKDEYASVKFFGTVYNLPGPLEDGLMLQVAGQPRLHPQYGFSINVDSVQPVGKGSIKRAASLLEAKLQAEGLFDQSRKRPLPYPPARIGLVTSSESAGYKDFIKILSQRWGGIDIQLADVQVQGDLAPTQIMAALEFFNSHSEPVELIVIIRGGGSPEDLMAYNTEQVTRAVAASRLPTIVAIGHETDLSLAELAADMRASTPSNAAELIVPDRLTALKQLTDEKAGLRLAALNFIKVSSKEISTKAQNLSSIWNQLWQEVWASLNLRSQIIETLNPAAILKRGYAIARYNGRILRSRKSIRRGNIIQVSLADGDIDARVQ